MAIKPFVPVVFLVIEYYSDVTYFSFVRYYSYDEHYSLKQAKVNQPFPNYYHDQALLMLCQFELN
jgi:hypothetical protein